MTSRDSRLIHMAKKTRKRSHANRKRQRTVVGKRRLDLAQISNALFRPGPGAEGHAVFRLFWPVLAAAWVTRVAVALTGDFILHPDEIYQYLEPAHANVFGNGLYTWEFAAGARSYLIPGFVTGVLYMFKILGLDSPNYYIPGVKIVFCTISLLLPASMYFFARNTWNERAGVIAFLLGCFWYEFVGFAHKPLSDMTSCYLIAAAMACASDRDKRPAMLALSAALMALSFGIRFQTVILTVPFALLCLIDLNFRQRMTYVVTGIAGLAVVGVLDHVAWGGLFHSVMLNIQSNLEANKLLDLSYQPPAHQFLLWFTVASSGLFWVAMAFALKNFKRYGMCLLLLTLFFATHSLLLHKEYRFAYPWLPLWLMAAADLIGRGIGLAERANLSRTAAKAVAALLVAIVSTLGIANALPKQKELYMSFSLAEDLQISFLKPDPHLKMYLFLANDPQVKGVVETTRAISSTGSYYYLHQKVPLYPANIFHEIQKGNATNFRFIDFVSHVVAATDDLMKHPLYEPVHQIGPYVLYRRKTDPDMPVHKLKSYRYAPDLHLMLSILPFLKRHMSEDYKLRFQSDEVQGEY